MIVFVCVDTLQLVCGEEYRYTANLWRFSTLRNQDIFVHACVSMCCCWLRVECVLPRSLYIRSMFESVWLTNLQTTDYLRVISCFRDAGRRDGARAGWRGDWARAKLALCEWRDSHWTERRMRWRRRSVKNITRMKLASIAWSSVCGVHVNEWIWGEKALQTELFMMVVIEYQSIFPCRIRGRRGGSRSTDCVMRCEEGGF